MNTETKADRNDIGSAKEGVDNSVYAVLPGQFTSRWFYFYRVRGHNDPVKGYRIKRPNDVPYTAVRQEIDSIYDEIEDRPPFGTRLGDIAWRHMGYIVFVLENSNEKVTDVEFYRKSGGINNSFLGGQIIDSVNGEADVSGFYCVNYMQSEAGGDLGADVAEVFKVKIRHRARAAGGADSIRGHEDAGTNLGPPRT